MLPCTDYCNVDIQNAYDKGYTTSVEVTNLLAFNIKGELIHAALNFPECWHDSKVAHALGLIYPLLQDDFITASGFEVICDSAFKAGHAVDHKIVWGRKSNESCDFQSVEMSAVHLIMQMVLSSKRQSAEWWVHAFKAPFGLLQLPLSTDSETRRRILLVCAYSRKFQTRRVGLNQIQIFYSKANEVCQPLTLRFMKEQNRVFL